MTARRFLQRNGHAILAPMTARQPEVPAPDRPRWVTRLTLAGAVLVAVFLALGLAHVETPDASCGTGFAPGWSEDAATDAACSAALGDRRLAMLLTGAPGVLLLGVASVARAVYRRPVTGGRGATSDPR